MRTTDLTTSATGFNCGGFEGTVFSIHSCFSMPLSGMYKLKWWLVYFAIIKGRFHLNYSPFHITLNFSLLVSWTSDSEEEPDVWLFDESDEKDDLFLSTLKFSFFHFLLSISSDSELEEELHFNFLRFFFLLVSLFLCRKNFASFAFTVSF